jgi:hypothetical protein
LLSGGRLKLTITKDDLVFVLNGASLQRPHSSIV